MNIILLDRDGVINEDSSHYIKSPAEWHPIPGSLEAIARLNKAGYKTIVTTNQSGIARGYYDENTLEKIHRTMQQALQAYGGNIDAIFICPHHPEAGCACRKPKPTLLLQALSQYNVEANSTVYIGDKWSDMEAAQAAGCQPILVQTGQGQHTVNNNSHACETIPIYKNLAHYVEDRLSHE
ncbi:MAG: D-glycero-beta-D-manno-heptose 1,7-bisphosphate 7-phosphatase [Gammaproteobacteria bacterium]